MQSYKNFNSVDDKHSLWPLKQLLLLFASDKGHSPLFKTFFILKDCTTLIINLTSHLYRCQLSIDIRNTVQKYIHYSTVLNNRLVVLIVLQDIFQKVVLAIGITPYRKIEERYDGTALRTLIKTGLRTGMKAGTTGTV